MIRRPADVHDVSSDHLTAGVEPRKNLMENKKHKMSSLVSFRFWLLVSEPLPMNRRLNVVGASVSPGDPGGWVVQEDGGSGALAPGRVS